MNQLPINAMACGKYLNISFFIVLPRRFKGAEQEKVKLLLVRYISLRRTAQGLARFFGSEDLSVSLSSEARGRVEATGAPSVVVGRGVDIRRIFRVCT